MWTLAVVAGRCNRQVDRRVILADDHAIVRAGLKASLLGTTRRSNGSRQVTYNKHPLYTYTLDKKAGQTKGEGMLVFGAKWYGVSAKGTAVVKRSTTTTTTTSSCLYPPC